MYDFFSLTDVQNIHIVDSYSLIRGIFARKNHLSVIAAENIMLIEYYNLADDKLKFI